MLEFSISGLCQFFWIVLYTLARLGLFKSNYSKSSEAPNKQKANPNLAQTEFYKIFLNKILVYVKKHLPITPPETQAFGPILNL